MAKGDMVLQRPPSREEAKRKAANDRKACLEEGRHAHSVHALRKLAGAKTG